MLPSRRASVASACSVSAPMRMTSLSSTVPGVRVRSANRPPVSTAASCFGSPIRRRTAPDSAAISVSAARFSVLAMPASSTRSMSPGRMVTGSASRLRPGAPGLRPSQVKVRESMVWQSVSMSSASTLAAAAEGARPMTWRPVFSHACTTTFMAVVLPVPAGPTPAASRVPAPTRWWASSFCPVLSGQPVVLSWAASAFSSLARGAITATGVRAASRTRVSASSTAWVVYFSALACRSIPAPVWPVRASGRLSGSGGVSSTMSSRSAMSMTVAWAWSRAPEEANR